MFKRNFLMAVIAVLVFAACTNETEDYMMQPMGDNVHSLSVGIESGTYVPETGLTRASMEAVIRVKWTEGDEVSVVNATTGKILGGCLKAEESGESVTFSGDVTGTINQGNVLYYVYPRITENENETAFSETNVSLASQTYDDNDKGNVSFYGYAQDVARANTGEISKKIAFTLVTSYVHLNMSNLPAKGFALNTIDISNVNEGFTWSLSDATLTAGAYEGDKGISVNCSNVKITPAGNAVVRFAIPASVASETGRKVTVNKAYTNDNYVKTELKSSTYYNQLYSNWTNENVTVEETAGEKKKVTIDNQGSTELAEGILPTTNVFTDQKSTEIKLGGLGTITFNQSASSAIINNAAGSSEVFFKMQDVTETKPAGLDADFVYEITMKTVGENGKEVFSSDNAGGGKATVAVNVGTGIEYTPTVTLIDENGQPIAGANPVSKIQYDKVSGILTFDVAHFSKYAIKFPDCVAMIGNTKYNTLQDAFNDVPDGVETTVTLYCDATAATLGDKDHIGAKKVVLELNGHSITGYMRGITTLTSYTSLDGATLVNYANLTINGEGTIGDLVGEYHHNALVNMSNGTNLTINGGTFVAKSCCVFHYSASNDANEATLNVNGGTFTTQESAATNKYVFGIGGKSGQTLKFNYENATAEGAKGIYCSLAGTTINIHSGSITADINAIYLSMGKNVTINIDGGTLKTLDSNNHENNYKSTGSYTGSSLPIYASAFGSENIVCYISGGNFEYPYCSSSGTKPATWERVINDGIGITSNVSNDNNITTYLTGGTYSTNQMLSDITKPNSAPSEIVAEGYTCIENEYGTWTVVKKE